MKGKVNLKMKKQQAAGSLPFLFAMCVSDFSMRWTRGEPSAVRRKLLSPFRSPSLRHYGIAGSYFYSYKFMFVDWS
jgi:hypothetical protein